MERLQAVVGSSASAMRQLKDRPSERTRRSLHSASRIRSSEGSSRSSTTFPALDGMSGGLGSSSTHARAARARSQGADKEGRIKMRVVLGDGVRKSRILTLGSDSSTSWPTSSRITSFDSESSISGPKFESLVRMRSKVSTNTVSTQTSHPAFPPLTALPIQEITTRSSETAFPTLQSPVDGYSAGPDADRSALDLNSIVAASSLCTYTDGGHVALDCDDVFSVIVPRLQRLSPETSGLPLAVVPRGRNGRQLYTRGCTPTSASSWEASALPLEQPTGGAALTFLGSTGPFGRQPTRGSLPIEQGRLSDAAARSREAMVELMFFTEDGLEEMHREAEEIIDFLRRSHRRRKAQ